MDIYTENHSILFYKRLQNPVFIFNLYSEEYNDHINSPTEQACYEILKVSPPNFEDWLNNRKKIIEQVFVSTILESREYKSSCARYVKELDHLIPCISPKNQEYISGLKITNVGLSTIEAHEQGHCIRSFADDSIVSKKLDKCFDFSNIIFSQEEKRVLKILGSIREEYDLEKIESEHIMYTKRSDELIERMAQLRNFFGMTYGEKFTEKHLDFIRKNYCKVLKIHPLQINIFLQAITEETLSYFILFINKFPI